MNDTLIVDSGETDLLIHGLSGPAQVISVNGVGLPGRDSAGNMLTDLYDPDEDGKVVSAVSADQVPWAGVQGKPVTVTQLVEGFMSAADKTKLDGVAVGATKNATDAALRARADHTGTQLAATISDFSTAADLRISSKIGVSIQAYNAALTGTTGTFTTAMSTKLGFVTVTAAVDLDDIRLKVLGLDQAVILKGTWDASLGSFPGAAAAQAGWTYIVSTGGTVNGQVFVNGDRIVAIVDNASATVFANNWFKEDYTDAVLSIAGRTGAVVLTAADIDDSGTAYKFMTAAQITKLAGIAAGAQVNPTNAATKVAYEANPDTNAFTDAEKTKLGGIAAGATVNATDAALRDRATHQGTQSTSTVDGLDAALAGKAASAHVHNATDINAGTLPDARLPTRIQETAMAGDLYTDANLIPMAGGWYRLINTALNTPSSGYLAVLVIPFSGTAGQQIAVSVDGASGNPRMWVRSYNVSVGGYSAWSQIVTPDQMRERLTANRNYYIRPDGVDTNTGLANTAGSAWLTLAKAMAVIATLDFNGHSVLVNLADGTYTGGCTIPVTVGQAATLNFIIRGNAASPGNVIISTTSSGCFAAGPGARARILDLEMRTTTTGNCLSATGGVLEYGNVRFGACAQAHIVILQGYCQAVTSSYEITGGAAQHVWSRDGGVWNAEFKTVTITGTPNFVYAFASCSMNGTMECAVATFTGAATGKRYSAVTGGAIMTGGGGESFFPGSIAGTVTSPGSYA